MPRQRRFAVSTHRGRNLDPNFVPDGRRGAPHLSKIRRGNTCFEDGATIDKATWLAFDWSTARVEDTFDLIVWNRLLEEEVFLRPQAHLGKRRPVWDSRYERWSWDPRLEDVKSSLPQDRLRT